MTKDDYLHTLCKQVYEATKWEDTEKYIEYRYNDDKLIAVEVCDNVGYEDDGIKFGTVMRTHIPLYTSDYIVNKLLSKIVKNDTTYGLVLTPCTTDGSWVADYLVASWGQPLAAHLGHWLHSGSNAQLTEGSTLLEALLKLTLRLAEEGLL